MLSKEGGNTFLSATKAIIDHLTDWYQGSERIVSMSVVLGENTYGLRKGICFSLPVLCKGNGDYKVVDWFELT